MKAIGFSQGQFGDLLINLIACRAFKRDYPDSKLIFGINEKYKSLQPIFENNPLIDGFHIWDGYDNWPTQKDKDFIKNSDFDKIFNPMPKHTEEHWFLNRHQAEECCLMNGLIPHDNLQINLNKYFGSEKHKGKVGINLYAETKSHNSKVPDLDIAKNYCSLIKKMGFEPIQLGLQHQQQICESRFIGSFLDTIKFALGCDFVLTVDSALSWIMSGYEHPTIGIYNYTYYKGAKSAKNWIPINKNAIYIENNDINIPEQYIEESIKNIC